jgi:hypothetical protein
VAGKDNLRTPTTEQAREIGRKGGKASAKARKRKKELKELLEIALSQPSEIVDGEDNYTAITVALIQKAIQGDTKAYEVIRDTLGQKPTEQQQMDLTAKIEVDYGE